MNAPQFTILNGQIKTPWRWYDSPDKLASENEPCVDQLGSCPHAVVLSAQDSLPPFQLPRPSSVQGVTEWGLYDTDGALVVDLTSQIGLLAIEQFQGYDYLVYDGAALSGLIPPGKYTSRITTAGQTYYSEPIAVVCLADPSDCSARLEWGNCGNVGNTYYAGGYMDSFWLAPRVVPVLPAPTIRIESEEQPSGDVVETFRRKEVRYTILFGQVPWYIADALSQMALVDTVRLYMRGSALEYDLLGDVRVDVEYDPPVSECMAEVRMSFRIEAEAVTCCEDFTGKCAEPCIEVDDFLSNVVGPPVGIWAYDNLPSYLDKRNDVDDPISYVCQSGVITVKARKNGGHGVSPVMIWSIELGMWIVPAAIAAVTCKDAGCSNIDVSLLPGYFGQLQYWNGFTWQDVPGWGFDSDGWDAIDPSEIIDCAGMLSWRIKITAGDCVLGYSEEQRLCG